jgi:hypothetical protein
MSSWTNTFGFQFQQPRGCVLFNFVHLILFSISGKYFELIIYFRIMFLQKTHSKKTDLNSLIPSESIISWYFILLKVEIIDSWIHVSFSMFFASIFLCISRQNQGPVYIVCSTNTIFPSLEPAEYFLNIQIEPFGIICLWTHQ